MKRLNGEQHQQEQQEQEHKGFGGHRFSGRKLQPENKKVHTDGAPPSHQPQASYQQQTLQKPYVPENLPITVVKDALMEEVRKSDSLVVVGETGSGKTTQIPQFLYRAGYGSIAVTQPRRVAAISIAARVAAEVGCEVGGTVGYAVRFEDATSRATRIKYMTDGMLLREAMLDPTLSAYSVVVLDEAHERTLHTDILFGLVKGAQKSYRAAASTATGGGEEEEGKEEPVKRRTSPLKIIVMSATLDAKLFSDYFDGAKVVWVLGRQFPVEIYYTPAPEEDYRDAALLTVFQINLGEPAGSGDILVFLTGQEEIEGLEKVLKEKARHQPPGAPGLLVCPIFAALPSEAQMRVFEPTPPGMRKVILATNIAETSITIPGIRYVVDTGVCKARGYNSRIGVETLAVVPVSKAQARQRAGRAGREGPGKCYRLYTEASFEGLRDTTVPEILRCNLSTVVLQLLALGVRNVRRFDYVERPSDEAMKRALVTLCSLGALDDRGAITEPLGRRMAQFPLDPQYAKTLIMAHDYRCSEEVLSVVAMLSAESVFVTNTLGSDQAGNSVKRVFATTEGGDHLTLLAVYNEYSKVAPAARRQWCKEHAINHKTMLKVENIRAQLRDYYTQLGLTLASAIAKPGDSTEQVRKCFVTGFFNNVATLRQDKTYRTVLRNQLVYVHPSSVLFGVKPQPPCLLYNELVHTSKSYMRDVTPISSRWLVEVAPHIFSKAKE